MEERLELLLKSLNLSPAQFADEIGLKRSGIYHIVKGRNKPGMEFFIKLLERYPEVRSDWLLLGKGQMFKQENPSMAEEPPIISTAKTTPQQIEKKEKEPYPTPPSKRQIQLSKKTSKSGLDIDRIVIFYADGTFTEHSPAH